MKNNNHQRPIKEDQPTIASLTSEQATKSNAIEVPQITLPKGGGAIKGIDEKFEVNAANGTVNLSLGFPLSKGRNGFTPSLGLAYNSGAGNSPFGLGWHLNISSIVRKTDKGIPRYHEGKEDTFMLSGTEDLVPFLKKNASGQWVKEEKTTAGNYTVKRYCPRIEGEFARIEKITHSNYGTYWKVTTGDNIATIFGRSTNARIADPEDATKDFKWLAEFSYDDKGNWIKYSYKAENLENVPIVLHEQNRHDGLAKIANTYLKSVRYGNKKPYYANPSKPYDPDDPTQTPGSEDEAHFFELVFDYGEHHADIPKTQEEPSQKWGCRIDPFSFFRAGFEVRTYRLCKRVLMFHKFQELGSEPYLVKSLDLSYEASNINNSGDSEITYLASATQSGYIKKEDGNYSKKSLPKIEYEYQSLVWDKSINQVSQESLANAPVGLTNNYQWVDLYNEGIPGIFHEQPRGWYYKENLGNIDGKGAQFAAATKIGSLPSFTGLNEGSLVLQDIEVNGEKQVVANTIGVKGFWELEPEGQGQKSVGNFTAFKKMPNIDWKDPDTKLIDLTGDGRPDLVVSEELAFTWYTSKGKEGYDEAQRTFKAQDENTGPAIIFSDTTQSIFLADMTGDGLSDIARIRNGGICFWANMGYGNYSAKVAMSNAPVFDHPGHFNPAYLHLADVSGTGATDIIYLGKNKFKAFINQNGNSWSDAHEVNPFLQIENHSKLSVIDLLGTGTSCIVMSTHIPSKHPMQYIDLMGSKKPHILKGYKNNFGKEVSFEYKSSTYFYLKDKKEGAPWITKLPFPVHIVAKTTVLDKIADVRFTNEYSYHHGYYDHEEREFRGFGRVDQLDSEYYPEWAQNNATNLLEKSEELYQQPVLSKTWYHTGAYLDKEKVLTHFKDEYWHKKFNRRFPSESLNVTEPELVDAKLSPEIKGLHGKEYREAIRACKGMVLRQEVFAMDAPQDATESQLKLQMKPYTVATHNCNIQLKQPREGNPHGVFVVTESEEITIHYERDETDYRLQHNLNTNIDEMGNILESAAVVYGRKQAKANAEFSGLSSSITDFSEDVLNNDSTQKTQLQNAFANNINSIKSAQTKTNITYTQNIFAKYDDGVTQHDDVDLPHVYRLRLPSETKTFEITGLAPSSELFQLTEFDNILANANDIGYHEQATAGIQKRLVEHIKTKYLGDTLNELGFGFFEPLGLTYQSYQLAFTTDLVKDIYIQAGAELKVDGNDVSSIIESSGGYSNINGSLWIRSGISHLKTDARENVANVKNRFYSPIKYEGPLGETTAVTYDTETFAGNIRNNDGYYLHIKKTKDAVGNKTQVDVFNYRTLSPSRMVDVNANPVSVLFDELGLVKAVAVEGNGVYTDTSETSVNVLTPADSLSGLKDYTDTGDATLEEQLFEAANSSHTNTTQLASAGNGLLQQATTRFIYNIDKYEKTGEPVVIVTVRREQHFADNNASKIQFSFNYLNGQGKIVMAKEQASPGLSYYMENSVLKQKDTSPELRWRANGRVVLNNKGKPVKQYEPYFSTNFLYENSQELVEMGVTPILYYDPLGRLVKTKFPDGTLSKVEFDPWKQVHYDQNDTVLDDECTWYKRRTNNTRADFISEANQQQAAQKAAAHANSPLSLYFDTLGRPVFRVEHNGKDAGGKDKLYSTFINLDIEGNTRDVKDTRGNLVMEYKYDMLGHRVLQNSMDAGKRWVLNNNMNNPVFSWDCRGHLYTFSYDAIQRLLSKKVSGGDGFTPLDSIYERLVYGEGQPNEIQDNLRGQVHSTYDMAGKNQNLQFDFKGNLLKSSREFNSNYKDIPNWDALSLTNPALFDPGLTAYITTQKYDALSRVTETTTPDGSITSPGYNEASLLSNLSVNQTDASEKLFIKSISYDAKRQREKVIYGDKNGNNLATTTFGYDKDTFRLVHLKTVKADNSLLQDLYYTYDPVGNITEIEDKAIPAKFFNNQKIEGKGKYNYDPLYRLKEAEGREHAGQAINFGQCDNWQDKAFLKSYSPIDDMAWRNYSQKYSYDPAGNIMETNHNANGGSWKREYKYETQSNRLKESKIGANTYSYTHQAEHGYITQLPHLQVMEWNFRDELQAVATQKTCSGIDPETTYYVYDPEGKRVRKVTEVNGGGSKKEERLYVGGIEVYRRSSDNFERTTLHVMDDKRRVAMVDTRNDVDDGTEKKTARFQFDNHLGSASLELNDSGDVIGYEEYHPFGTTAYQAVNKDIKIAAKRYRYTGLERDEETGFNYHSARYYLPWLCRWLKPDPHLQRYIPQTPYSYAINSPLKVIDPGGKDVVVIYRGGVTGDATPIAPENAGTAGKLAQSIQAHAAETGTELDVVILEPGVTSSGAVQAGMEFIREHRSEGEALIIYGYSRGGDVAVDLADELNNKEQSVDLLFTIDAAYGPLSTTVFLSPIDREIPGNVDVNINYYQTNASGPSGVSRTGQGSSDSSGSNEDDSSGGGSSQAGGSSRSDSGSSDLMGSRGDANTPLEAGTRVYNIEISNTQHGDMDEKVQDRVIGHVESFMGANRAGRRWTPENLSQYRYQWPQSIWEEATKGTPLSPSYRPSQLGWEYDFIMWFQRGLLYGS